MNPAIFDDLERTYKKAGATAAIERLIYSLREQKDYGALFYALLLKKRHELGVSPVPTGPSLDLPAQAHEPYEEAIREAGRLVGKLYLQEGNIPQAWAYFRMLGEPEPVAKALESYQPGEQDDVQQVVEIAFHHGVNPRKGFDLLLDRCGICSAITMVSGQDFSSMPDVRDHCIKRLVRALHNELRERLTAEIARREQESRPETLGPPVASVAQAPEDSGPLTDLLAGRDWLFEDEFAHIDVSHLGAVVQMSIFLSPSVELQLARELCEYGKHLSTRFQYAGEPPFEDQYHDYGTYLAVLAGDEVEEGIAHFQFKVENANPETTGTGPAEVLVNLLLRMDRPADALAVAKRYLADTKGSPLSCPGIADLCQRSKDFQSLAEVARAQGDAVHFVAGLIASQGASCATKV